MYKDVMKLLRKGLAVIETRIKDFDPTSNL